MTLAMVLRTFCRLERGEGGDGEKGEGKGNVVVKGIRLWETDRTDVDMRCDMGFPTPKKGRGNVRVVLE